MHEGGYRVDRRGNFHDLWGKPLPTVPPLPRGDPDELLERQRELAIDAATCEPGEGEPAEPADLVDALLAIPDEAHPETHAFQASYAA